MADSTHPLQTEFNEIPTNSPVSNNQLPTDSRGPNLKRFSFFTS